MSLSAFGTASFLPRYTPAQLAAHERIKAIRARLGAQHTRKQFILPTPKEPPPVAPVYSEAFLAALPRVGADPTRRRNLKQKAERIMSLVCRANRVFPGEVLGRAQSAAIMRARHWYVWCLYRFTDLSLCQLASMIGRDHTTVRASMQSVVAKGGGMGERQYPPSRFKPSRKAPAFDPGPIDIILPPAQKLWTNAEIETVRQMMMEGRKRIEICRALNRSYDAVDKVLRRLRNERDAKRAAA